MMSSETVILYDLCAIHYCCAIVGRFYPSYASLLYKNLRKIKGVALYPIVLLLMVIGIQ